MVFLVGALVDGKMIHTFHRFCSECVISDVPQAVIIVLSVNKKKHLIHHCACFK